MGSTDYHERRIATKDRIERPFVVAEIQTGADIPRRIACQGSSLVWVSGIDDVIEAWVLQDGSCVTDIFKTRSARRPTDLAMSPKGRVVYSDHYKRKILKWVKGRIKVVLQFKKWRPLGICYTSGGELIVGPSNREYSQKKIRRYLGRSLRQEIQYDKEGRSVFTPGDLALFVEENKNSDLCVSDCQARIVLVMDRCGGVRTRYGGGHVGDKFNPGCLATDSSCRVLVIDTGNDLIHILDQNGQLLGFIGGLSGVTGCVGIAVDRENRAWVTECHTAKIKVIQYT